MQQAIPSKSSIYLLQLNTAIYSDDSWTCREWCGNQLVAISRSLALGEAADGWRQATVKAAGAPSAVQQVGTVSTTRYCLMSNFVIYKSCDEYIN